MAEKILIIDDDVDTLRLVGLMLQRQGYQIVAATNGRQGLAKAFEENPDLILLDVMMPDMDGYEVAKQLRQKPVTANTPILMFTAKTQLDDKVAGFEVGADDYLTKPTHPSELQAHVKALLARSSKVSDKSATAVHEHHGFVVGVLSARGGLGVSSVAFNLGAALLPKAGSDVIVAELTPGQGSLGLDLGMSNPQGLTNLLSIAVSEIDRGKVQDTLVSHNSGLRLLLASYRPRDVHLNNQIAQFEAIIPHLTAQARFIILDLGSGLPAYVQRLLPLCDLRIVVVEGTPNIITHTRALLDDMSALSIDKKQTVAVLNNRIRTDMQLPWTQVQEKLGHSVGVTFTPAPELFYQATRQRTAPILVQPDSLTTQQYAKLADLVAEREAQPK